MDSSDFNRDPHVEPEKLKDALNTVCNHLIDMHPKLVGTEVDNAVKYIKKAVSDEDLVMVYYP